MKKYILLTILTCFALLALALIVNRTQWRARLDTRLIVLELSETEGSAATKTNAVFLEINAQNNSVSNNANGDKQNAVQDVDNKTHLVNTRVASNDNDGKISNIEAIIIAKKNIDGKIHYDKTKEITVERSDGIIRITFPVELPIGARGPDYAAEVTIDAETGAIIEAYVGS